MSVTDTSDSSLEGLTHAASSFAATLAFETLPEETVRLAKRCVIDGVGVALAGSQQPGMQPLRQHIQRMGGVADARLLAGDGDALPVALAALWFGTAGHAMDWDDTQLAEGPGRPYGLLMHPTMPPLAATLSVADYLARQHGVTISGQRLLAAFMAGFEVGCKVAEAIAPTHYMRGFHTSGTVGTFAAAAAAANMLQLDVPQTAQALGIAASMASGIRANFGTMTKPLHVGRAAENGVNAAMLSQVGFTANDTALDGQWGYLAVAGPGGESERVRDRFGNPFALASPGVSIKPYPSGVLTHPSMDALRALMDEEQLQPGDVTRVVLYAGSNVLGPIRFQRAMTPLEGKFSFQFLLAAIILRGKVGTAEFTADFVAGDACQQMQGLIETQFDQGVEDLGWDKIRSRIELTTRDGKHYTRWADERYRGGPDHPLSDGELESKLRDCASNVVDDDTLERLISNIWRLDELEDVSVVLADLAQPSPMRTGGS
ncbi:MAG: 2-methylcitrate dehydratase PrpD [Halieaceae bacterium]|jgi:2-methylcitrate dehydratase PrpD